MVKVEKVEPMAAFPTDLMRLLILELAVAEGVHKADLVTAETAEAV
jgi:hypothetical protein